MESKIIMTKLFYEKLKQISSDPEQKEAYISNDSMVVLAGPGSGKTTVLTLKVIRLLSEKISEPRGIACVTYSREAAREFKERLVKLELPNRKNVFLGTVHGFCLKEVITPYAHLYPQYKIPNPTKLISEKKKNEIFNKLKEETGIDIDILKMDRERTREIEGLSEIGTEQNESAIGIAAAYEMEIQKQGLVDYVSLVKYAALLIQNECLVRNCLVTKFPWLIIDEYQDLGKPLHEMVLSLITKTNMKYFAVGDPDQSIYDFQGASPEYLLELESKFSKRSLRLTNNYRSAQEIVSASEVVLGETRNYRANGPLKDHAAEIEFVTCEAEMISQYNEIIKRITSNQENGIPYHEMAILCANKYQISDVCKFLKNNDFDFYVSKHPFDISDTLRWLQKCAGWVTGQAQSFEELFLFWKELNKGKKNLVEEKIIILKRKLFYILSANEQTKSLKEWVAYIFEELDIGSLLEINDHYPDEQDNLRKFTNCLKIEPYNNYSLLEFYKMGIPENQVVVSTRHGSKGLEFDVVFMIGMEDGNFPHYKCSKNEEEESYRICFVCISRARKKCVLLRSKYFMLQTKNGPWYKPYGPSRFWKMLNKSKNIK
jgi:DNA helicase-2/ATP-dependent DNA helicase PcrA